MEYRKQPEVTLKEVISKNKFFVFWVRKKRIGWHLFKYLISIDVNKFWIK